MNTSLKFTSLLTLLPLVVCGQSPFGGSSSSKDDEPSGLDQIDATRYVSYDYQSTKINPDRDHHNSQKSAYVRKLLDEANRQLLFEIQQNKRVRASKQRFLDKDRIFASAWENSRTGMLSGISWYDLSESEKAVHKESFLRYHDKKNHDSNAPSVSEIEVAKAWVQSPTGRKSGVLWRELTQSEKQFYKNRYMKFKSRNLEQDSLLAGNYRTSIEQVEYKEAWNSSRSRARSGKDWHELGSVEKSKFRKLYSQAKRTAMYDNQLLASK